MELTVLKLPSGNSRDLSDYKLHCHPQYALQFLLKVKVLHFLMLLVCWSSYFPTGEKKILLGVGCFGGHWRMSLEKTCWGDLNFLLGRVRWVCYIGVSLAICLFAATSS